MNYEIDDNIFNGFYRSGKWFITSRYYKLYLKDEKGKYRLITFYVYFDYMHDVELPVTKAVKRLFIDYLNKLDNTISRDYNLKQLFRFLKSNKKNAAKYTRQDLMLDYKLVTKKKQPKGYDVSIYYRTDDLGNLQMNVIDTNTDRLKTLYEKDTTLFLQPFRYWYNELLTSGEFKNDYNNIRKVCGESL